MRNRSIVLLAAALALFGAAVFLVAQTPITGLWFMLWNPASHRYELRQGDAASFQILPNGKIGILAPATPSIPVWDTAKLTANADGSYSLPAGAQGSSARVYVNGLRYASPEDFTVSTGKIVPSCSAGPPECNWPLPGSTVVTLDYLR